MDIIYKLKFFDVFIRRIIHSIHTSISMENQKACQTSLQILLNKTSPLIDKFRAVFTLRNIGGTESIDGIFASIKNDTSELLKHECAYCLGQMKDPYAINQLLIILRNEDEEIIVRHEAAEALAAIGIENDEIIKTLQTYMDHSCKELRETCYLALKRFSWLKKVVPQPQGHDQCPNGTQSPDGGDCHAAHAYDGSVIAYDTVDPTPSLLPAEHGGQRLGEASMLEQARGILLDESADLYDRYRALFTLRDIGSDAACEVMGQVLQSTVENDGRKSGSSSALLKHEVAFVLGQMQNPVPLSALECRLKDLKEHPMVRHECAEAIGSITGAVSTSSTNTGGDGPKLVDVGHYRDLLQHYLNDPVPIVRESCAVALDIADYVSDARQFQFVQP